MSRFYHLSEASVATIRVLFVSVVFGASIQASENGTTNDLEARAVAGDAHAQFLLGFGRTAETKDHKQNLEDAYAWLRCSSIRGYYPAAFHLESVTRALDQKGQLQKAKERYIEVSAMIADKPSEEVTFRLIADNAIGYKFYISSRWEEPKTENSIITLRLKTGGTAWLRLYPRTREDDKDLRDRIKAPDPVLALQMVEMLQKQFGNAKLMKHGPSRVAVAKDAYYVVAEIPAANGYSARTAFIILEPCVDKMAALEFITYTTNAQTESEEFFGLVETYDYTPPDLTRAMDNFLNEIRAKK